MKVPKPFSIDIELLDELKKIENPSKLVNDLLTDYIFGGNHLEEEDIKIKLKKIEDDKKRLDNQTINLSEKLKEIQKNKKVGKEILDNGKVETIKRKGRTIFKYN